MPTTPENQPQNVKRKLDAIGASLVDFFFHVLKDSKFNGVSALSAVAILVGIKIFSLIKPGIPEIAKQAKLEDVVIVSLSLLFIIFALIVNYLNNNQSKFDKKFKSIIQETEQSIATRQEEAMRAIHNLGNAKNEHANESTNEKESALIEEELKKIYAEFIDNKNKLKSNKKKLKARALYQKIDNAVERLKKEIEQLSRRANINLGIGSTVTISALSSLSYFIIHENFNSPDIKLALFHFVPRLSLVVFIEFFSFFFLKLYRANLQEIKYYQNELTNLEVKAIAIELAIKDGSKDDVSILVKDMSLVERNFKLQKGESTVELERNKAETHDLREVLKVLIATYKKDK